jgi:hypothetical protein
MVRDFGGVTVINVGTLLGSDDPCFAWIDFGAGQVLFYAITSEGDIREAARHAL